jgi:hypothetical protein
MPRPARRAVASRRRCCPATTRRRCSLGPSAPQAPERSHGAGVLLTAP